MRLKILMVTSFYPPYHVGGACIHVYHLSNELARAGHEVHVLFSKDAYNLIRKKKRKIRYPNHENVHLHPISAKIGRFDPLLSYITGISTDKRVKEIISRKYDIIHYHNISLFGPRVLKYGTSKKIYTCHDHWLVCPFNDMIHDNEPCKSPGKLKCPVCLIKNRRPPQLWRNQPVLKKNLKEISLIITPSEYMKNFLRRHEIKNRITVLPNFVKLPNNDIKNTENDFFLFVGMLEELKGIKRLLEAFNGLSQKLIIVGEGSLKRYVEKEISSMDNITYLGYLHPEKLYPLFKNANALILPSICNENNPLTILEAMSVGTPAIGSDTGGIPELINKIDRNLVFSDITGLIKRIESFDKKRYDSDEIINLQREQYSPKGFLKKYMEIIKDV